MTITSADQRPTGVILLPPFPERLVAGDIPGKKSGQFPVEPRFFNEARAAGRVEDRSVISVYEFDRTAEGAAYIIMEYLAGDSLRHHLRHNPNEVLAKFLPWTRQMASGLAATHAKQIVHREVLMIDSDCLRSCGKSLQRRRQDYDKLQTV